MPAAIPFIAAIAQSTGAGIAAFGAVASGGAVFAGVVVGALASVAVIVGGSLVLSSVSSAIRGSPKSKTGQQTSITQTISGRTLTVRQPITVRRVIYGEVRVGGPQTFLESTSSSGIAANTKNGDNSYLHQLITISGHPIDSFVGFMVDDEFVDLDSNNMVNTGKWIPASGDNPIFVRGGLGTTAGDAQLHTDLRSSSSLWTTNHKQINCAKYYTQFEFTDRKQLFQGGAPAVTAIVRGKQLFDTRDSATKWSMNPALAVYDYLTNSDYGKGESAAGINTASFDTAANICEERVSTRITRTFTASASTDELTLSSSAAGIKQGNAVTLSTTGALPAPLVAGTKYYFIPSSDAKLAISKADALNGNSINITSAGTGTHTLTREQTATFTASASTDEITLSESIVNLFTGDGIRLTNSGGALPAGLSTATTYYVRRTGNLKFKLATNFANAMAGTVIDITGAGTGTHTASRWDEPRYTCNGTFDYDQQPKEIFQQLLSAMHGKITQVGGEWIIYAGAYVTPTITIDETNILAPIELQTNVSRTELFNGVKGVFSNPEKNYQPDDFPRVTNATYLAEDQAENIWKDTELLFTVSPSMAQRIGKIDLEQARQQFTVKLTCDLTMLRVQPGDTVSVDYTVFGWSAKVFEVVDSIMSAQGDEFGGIIFVIDLFLRETASAVYDWDSGEESTVDIAPNTNLPDAWTVGDPTALTVTEVLYSSKDGGGVKARAEMSWSAPSDAFTDHYIVEHKLTTASAWIEDSGKIRSTAFIINDLAPGVYDFGVTAVNINGVQSDRVTKTKEIFGLSAAPTAPQNFTVSAIGGLALVRWDRSTDLDVTEGGKIVFKHDPLTTGAAWSTSVTIGKAVGGGETEAILPLKPGTYLAKFVDTSGIFSAVSTVTTKQASVHTFSGLTSIDEANGGFNGTHSGTFDDGGVLKLLGATNIDDWGNIDDVVDWDSEGGINSTGTYTFQNSFDFGSVVNKRLTTVITVKIENVLELIDSRAGNIDDWEDFDGIGGSEADARVWVRHTDDDPAGSPTWTSWQLLDSAEFNARAFQFKLLMTSDDTAYNVNVSALSINAENV